MLKRARNSLKKIALRVPPITRLVAQRDALVMERDREIARHTDSLRELDIAVREKNSLASAQEKLEQDRDHAINRVARAEAEESAKILVLEGRLKKLEAEKVALQEKVENGEGRLVRFGEGPPWVPNGHFYSPIAPRHEIEKYCAMAFESFPRTLSDIDLREGEQFKFVEIARGFYADLPFQDQKVEGLRYQYANQAFTYSDGIMLNTMVRHVQPKRVIEVGSGHSSCMLLDTNEIWFNNSINCSFIEPYPDLLESLIKPEDSDRITVYPSRVQDVPLSVFATLRRNDILFIDSTHVSRVGSDVNHILFNILPALATGVIIHFHDIIYPFEYFKDWLEEGRAWNEAYLLRAFLQNNKDYEIVMFNSFMNRFHSEYFEEHLPLCRRGPGGSIWLRKIA